MSISLRKFCHGLFAVTTFLMLGACGGGGDGGTAPITTAPGSGGAGSGGTGSGGGGGSGAGGGGGSGGGASGTGTLRVALTDAPSCGYDHVYVTVDRVRVHMSSTASDNDGGWSEVVVNPAQRIDLLDLTNGVLVELGQTLLPAGEYSQVRLVLRPNGGGTPANAVVPQGGSEIALDTPSATQSGLKLVHGFTVPPNALVDLVLDFDACRSIVKRGNSGRYNLKPVISVIPRTLTATAIAGYVQTGLTGVTVSAQKNGVVLKATQPNASGQFVLAPLDPMKGPYDVVFTGENLTTSVIAGVPVVKEQITTLNSSLDRVTMPTSTSGTVTGNVGPAGARDTGSVRALQTVGTVPVVEVAQVNIDPTTGDYSLFLPTAAPRLLTYSNPMVTPLNFVAQSANAGKYKLEVSATGYQTQLGAEITVTFGSILGGQNFTLVPMAVATIAGYVQTGVTGVTVSAQKGGVVMQATQPNMSGQFVLGSLDAMNGPYDVVFTGTNLTTSVIASVPVAVGPPTALGSSTDQVPMPPSQTGMVTGNVGPAAARASASVRALQTVGTVPAIEVARVSVNPLTGNYSLDLPVAAPRLLIYSSSMVTPLNFVAQPASAGKYRLAALATGYLTALGSEVTVLFGSILGGQDFTLATAK